MSERDAIYVALLDEGTDVWRPVEAKRLSHDCYLIVDQGYDRGVERWEFEPGTAVRCRKENRDGRHILVATEAARQTVAGWPRASQSALQLRWRDGDASEVELADYHWEELMMTREERIECAMRPVHPGEILRDELAELELSARAFASALDIPVNRVTQILRGQRGVSADSALRLGCYFGTSPEFWMDLQSGYELRRARQEVGQAIEQTVCPGAA